MNHPTYSYLNKETGNLTSSRNVRVFIFCILTYNKATIRTNHVPRSVVLHQDGIRVIRTLDSGKASQTISTKEAELQFND